jgi:ABC-type multidrug transport system fused ATPase/permease subunit
MEILDELPEPMGVVDGPMPRFQGHIRFDHVEFGYEPGRPVLRDITIEIPPLRRVALVGLSGSGKTTLAKLIPGFHDAWSGSVSIDGQDILEIPLAVLRRNISFVPQDSVLFEGTVRENLAIGRPDATDEEIIEAATRAHVHDAITSMPDGYQSWIREGGKNLSSGQRQRLAIARALLRDAPILLLDEPTASLDVEAEAEVMHALDTLIEGRTVLMISHRLSTLGHVDEIIVLEHGVIVEHGTPARLRKSGGVFARMLAEQNRYSGTAQSSRSSGRRRRDVHSA